MIIMQIAKISVYTHTRRPHVCRRPVLRFGKCDFAINN